MTLTSDLETTILVTFLNRELARNVIWQDKINFHISMISSSVNGDLNTFSFLI